MGHVHLLIPVAFFTNIISSLGTIKNAIAQLAKYFNAETLPLDEQRQNTLNNF